jgi:hypothetical protein
MHANITVYPSAASFRMLDGLGFKERNSFEGATQSRREVPTDDEVVELDAYKLAVLVSVGVAILSLCL